MDQNWLQAAAFRTQLMQLRARRVSSLPAIANADRIIATTARVAIGLNWIEMLDIAVAAWGMGSAGIAPDTAIIHTAAGIAPAAVTTRYTKPELVCCAGAAAARVRVCC
jgi:hypothetical protein